MGMHPQFEYPIESIVAARKLNPAPSMDGRRNFFQFDHASGFSSLLTKAVSSDEDLKIKPDWFLGTVGEERNHKGDINIRGTVGCASIDFIAVALPFT